MPSAPISPLQGFQGFVFCKFFAAAGVFPAMLHGENERVTEGRRAGGASADDAVFRLFPRVRATLGQLVY
jgi:hypothetical protein